MGRHIHSPAVSVSLAPAHSSGLKAVDALMLKMRDGPRTNLLLALSVSALDRNYAVLYCCCCVPRMKRPPLLR